jgi:hypothetical protein
LHADPEEEDTHNTDADSGRAAYALALWRDLGCPPVALGPAQRIFDMELYLGRHPGEADRMAAVLEGMASHGVEP